MTRSRVELELLRQRGRRSFTSVLRAIPLLAALPLSPSRGDEAPAREGARQPAVERALSLAGSNRGELEKALRDAPEAQRGGVEFLVENMPRRDLEGLTAAFLLENAALAYAAIERAPWRTSIPEDIFLNEILPYASASERRESWRGKLREVCAPLTADCKTPAEAAHRLNQKLFGAVNVRYSTGRKRADQGPLESMETGVASCTGLSILLVDACRSVAVPARLAGVPDWTNGRGNHTWVEVWDQGWHFTGAAEPAAEGLDHAWFVHDASLAVRDSREHAIYAASFKRTPLAFPMVWAGGDDSVSAVNVTDRYAASRPSAPSTARLRIDVRSRSGGARVAARVVVTARDDPPARLEGTSKDARFDSNDILVFELARGRTYDLRVEHEGTALWREYVSDKDGGVVELFLDAEGAASSGLPRAGAQDLRRACADFFAAAPEEQAGWKFDPALELLLAEDEAAARQAAWAAYCTAPIHEASRRDRGAHEVRLREHLSPYTLKSVGERPPGGWPLFIALHGGGGAPKEVNDSQWRVMQEYYRDQPSAGGYLYLALRAPNDTWNGFYADYVYPLVENLIRQLLLFDGVDPDRVFVMGYSHGGYGAFAIGPKMPDRFAAIHSSAAAPTDGESSARTLRNTVFTFMVGENDHDYGRVERCGAFDEAVRKLRGGRTDIYPVTLELKAGFGHRGLPDRDKIRDMYPAVRNPAPRELSWEMTDAVVRSFYWLRVPHPGKTQLIDAACRENRVVVKTTGVGEASLLLDGRLVDFRRPVVLDINGSSSRRNLEPGLRALCQSLLERGDPGLAFTAKVDLDLQGAGGR